MLLPGERRDVRERLYHLHLRHERLHLVVDLLNLLALRHKGDDACHGDNAAKSDFLFVAVNVLEPRFSRRDAEIVDDCLALDSARCATARLASVADAATIKSVSILRTRILRLVFGHTRAAVPTEDGKNGGKRVCVRHFLRALHRAHRVTTYTLLAVILAASIEPPQAYYDHIQANFISYPDDR